MADNILILGNGFDLAMGRKTSYSDFLAFSNILNIFNRMLSDKKLDVTEENIISEFENLNKAIDSFCKEWEDSEFTTRVKNLEFKDETQKIVAIRESIPTGYKFINDIKNNRNNISSSKARQIFRKLDLEDDLVFDLKIILKLIQENESKTLQWLFKLPSNYFINFIENHKQYYGKNWSSIEHIISDLAEGISFLKQHISEIAILFSDVDKMERDAEATKLKKAFDNESNASAIHFLIDMISKKLFEGTGLNRIALINSINEEFIIELEQLTEYLEFYLTYLGILDFVKRPIKREATALDAIQNIEQAKVITFNYTNTPSQLFKISKENSHYIHGQINWNNHKEINNMVFGIEDKEDKVEDVNADLIPYQKFYQRTVKETGNDFETFFKLGRTYSEGFPISINKNIIVFGHSVDPLDKEVFKKCFKLTEANRKFYRFIFTYYTGEDKNSIVKNLAIILGKNELVTLTGEKKIQFVQSNDIEGMREKLLK